MASDIPFLNEAMARACFSSDVMEQSYGACGDSVVNATTSSSEVVFVASMAPVVSSVAVGSVALVSAVAPCVEVSSLVVATVSVGG